MYIYCTKGKTNLFIEDIDCPFESNEKCLLVKGKGYPEYHHLSNGKVVCRFFCDKIEEIDAYWDTPGETFYYNTISLKEQELLEKSCIDYTELDDYIFNSSKDYVYAIYISQLEIFDRPKKLSEFYKSFKNKYCESSFSYDTHKEGEALVQPIKSGYEYTYPLTKAPQNFCYIEVEDGKIEYL